jgi:hypothetical protein
VLFDQSGDLLLGYEESGPASRSLLGAQPALLYRLFDIPRPHRPAEGVLESRSGLPHRQEPHADLPASPNIDGVTARVCRLPLGFNSSVDTFRFELVEHVLHGV